MKLCDTMTGGTCSRQFTNGQGQGPRKARNKSRQLLRRRRPCSEQNGDGEGEGGDDGVKLSTQDSGVWLEAAMANDEWAMGDG